MLPPAPSTLLASGLRESHLGGGWLGLPVTDADLQYAKQTLIFRNTKEDSSMDTCGFHTCPSTFNRSTIIPAQYPLGYLPSTEVP